MPDQLPQICNWKGTPEAFISISNLFIAHPKIPNALTNARLYKDYVDRMRMTERHSENGKRGGLAKQKNLQFNNNIVALLAFR